MATFSLSKWYLDWVTDAGEVTVAYTGKVRWGPVRLHYSSILETTGSRVRERRTLRPQAPPEVSESVVRWNVKALKFDSAWEAVCPGMRETIYQCSEGSVEWNCIMPLARARSGERSGLGYVEHLSMTVPPWKLPIHTLRWGRFTSASDWVTWIDWEGEYARRVVYHNGRKISCATIGDDRLEAEDGTQILMDRSLVLRKGALGTTALARVASLRKTFPARLLQIHECKWRSWSRLERQGKLPVEGWAIHEKVSWAP